MSTDPTRFIKVGVCDSARLGCWLDKRSVDRAITDNNIGVRNSTLTELEAFNKNSLKSQQDILSSTEFLSQLKIISDRIEKKGVSVSELPGVIKSLDDLNGDLKIVLFNSHRAEIIYWKARAYASTFKSLVSKDAPKVTPTGLSAECSVAQDCEILYGTIPGIVYSCVNGGCVSNTDDEFNTPSTASASFVQIRLLSNNMYQIYLGGTNVGYIDEDNDVFLSDGTNIGFLENGRIRFRGNDKTVRDAIEEVFGVGSFATLNARSSVNELTEGYDLRVAGGVPGVAAESFNIILSAANSEGKSYLKLNGQNTVVYIQGNSVRGVVDSQDIEIGRVSANDQLLMDITPSQFNSLFSVPNLYIRIHTNYLEALRNGITFSSDSGFTDVIVDKR